MDGAEGLEHHEGTDPAEGSGTSWLLVGLERGVALGVVYGVLWMAVGGVVDLVSDSETGTVSFGFMITLVGFPVGALAGTLLGMICAVVDRRTGRRLTRRTVAARVIGTVAVATGLWAAAGIDYWAIFVGGPCALGLVSLWAWRLPERPPPKLKAIRAER